MPMASTMASSETVLAEYHRVRTTKVAIRLTGTATSGISVARSDPRNRNHQYDEDEAHQRVDHTSIVSFTKTVVS